VRQAQQQPSRGCLPSRAKEARAQPEQREFLFQVGQASQHQRPSTEAAE